MKSIHATVLGKVQGVFFRASTRRKAQSLAVAGRVRNCSNGSVELYATGEDDSIAKLIAWLHKGPVVARVDKVVVTDIELIQFDDFVIE